MSARGVIARWALAVLAAGCGGSSQAARSAEIRGRIADLQREQWEQEQRLIEVRREIALAEAELAQARLEAEQHRCEARKAAVEASIEVRYSECIAHIAEYRGCVAENSEQSANNGFLGALGGAILTFVSGGLAAPAVLGGAALGRMASRSDIEACGQVPQCSVTREEAQAAVLSEEHLSEVPTCPSAAPEPAPAQ